ncbi:HAMP domain-containing sensor histidine kinase [Vallitalea sediminicola]
MKSFLSDNNIKKYILDLIGVYTVIILLIAGIDILNVYKEFEVLNTYKYVIVKFLVLLLIIMSSLIGYKIIKYIYDRLNSIDKNITLAMNGNYNSDKDKYNVPKYSEGTLYRIDYQLDKLISKSYNNNENLIDEKKKLNMLVTEITHQLKTPVAAIKLFNSLLDKDNIEDTEKYNIISKMNDEINRVQWFVSSLTEISKLETGLIQLDIKENDINKTITHAVNSIYISARQKNIEISMRKNSNKYFYYDSKWTKEAIVNILDNAVKYTDMNGTITIECVNTVMSNKIRITDTGRGINEEDIPFIFDRFYKCNKTGLDEGIGVGLYLAKEIMKSQDGSIKVYSKIGSGTTFELIFYND